MLVTPDVPDDIGEVLAAGGDLSRRALEMLAVDGYRRETLTQLQVGRLLGLSRLESEDFLAQYVDLYSSDPGELRREAEALEKFAGFKGV